MIGVERETERLVVDSGMLEGTTGGITENPMDADGVGTLRLGSTVGRTGGPTENDGNTRLMFCPSTAWRRLRTRIDASNNIVKSLFLKKLQREGVLQRIVRRRRPDPFKCFPKTSMTRCQYSLSPFSL